MDILNAHCHASDLMKVIDKAESQQTMFFVNAGVWEEETCPNFDKECMFSKDIEVLKSLKAYSNVKCFWGIHPWYINHYRLESVEEFLEKARSEGFGLGEVGLDRARKGIADFELQKKILRQQFEAFAQSDRGIGMHIVRAWGEAFNILEDCFGKKADRAIMIHDFNSNIENCQRLLRQDIFISISQNFFKFKKNYEILKIIPLERLLLEDENLGGLERMESLYEQVSKIKNIDKGSLKNICLENGKIF